MKKIFITTAIIASLVLSSTAAFAAVTSSNTADAKIQAENSTVVKSTDQGNIEYAKRTILSPDGSLAAIEESWADPSTSNERVDYSEPTKGTNELVRTQSCFVLDNETRYIKAGRDEKGSFNGITFSGENLGKILEAEKQDYINEYKDGTRRAGWSNEGVIKAKDGKELKKLSRSDTSPIPGDEGKTFIENIYLDKDSGLPVKGDISVEKNGKISLIYTYVYEFKDVADDGSLFDTTGIKLQEIK